MAIRSLDNSCTILEVRCSRISIGGLFSPGIGLKSGDYCKEYLCGYSRVTKFSNDDKDAFCEDLGHWVAYNDLYRTRLKKLPEKYYFTAFMTPEQVNRVKNGKVTLDMLLDPSNSPENEIKNMPLDENQTYLIRKLNDEIAQLGLEPHMLLFSMSFEEFKYIYDLIPLYQQIYEHNLYTISFQQFLITLLQRINKEENDND